MAADGMGGKYYIPARKEVRASAGVKHGDRVTVQMRLEQALVMLREGSKGPKA